MELLLAQRLESMEVFSESQGTGPSLHLKIASSFLFFVWGGGVGWWCLSTPIFQHQFSIEMDFAPVS